MRQIRIYYAAPYSKPYPINNMHNAMHVWKQLWDAGYIPTCPHWTGFQDLITPMDYRQWLEYDLYGLPLHHAILRGPGASSGADDEVAIGRKLGMPIFNSFADLVTTIPPTTNPIILAYDPVRHVDVAAVFKDHVHE